MMYFDFFKFLVIRYNWGIYCGEELKFQLEGRYRKIRKYRQNFGNFRGRILKEYLFPYLDLALYPSWPRDNLPSTSG